MADKPGVFGMLGDMTAAQQHLYSKAAGSRGGRTSARRRKKKSGKRTSTRSRPRRRASARGSKRTKMVKGSAAAKAWGRRMKRLRKK